MKVLSIMCLLLIPLTLQAGTWKYDFKDKWDYGDDCKNGTWVEDTDWFLWDGGVIRTNLLAGEDACMETGSIDARNYTVEVRARPIKIGKYGFGFIVRRTCTGCFPCYQATIGPDGVSLFKDYYLTKLTSAPFEVALGTWYSLKLVIKDSQLDFFVDGKLMATVVDATYPKGRAGIVAFGEVEFDDFVLSGDDIIDGGRWDAKAH